MGSFTNLSGSGGGGVTVAEVQDSTYTYAADAEASDTYVITLSTAPSAYATGQLFHFKANTVNTGAATLNVNSLGAKTIKKHHDQDLADGDIEAGSTVSVIYDGTNFQMTSQLGNAGGGGGGAAQRPYLFGGDVTKDSSDNYMTRLQIFGSDNETLVADEIGFTLMHIPAGTYTRMGLAVLASAASTTIRIGLYEVDSTTGAPGALILDAGTIDSSTTGVKEITISETLTDAPFYFAHICDGAPLIRGVANTLTEPVLMHHTFTSSSETFWLRKPSQSGEHTSLSDPAVSSLTSDTSSCLKPFLRIV